MDSILGTGNSDIWVVLLCVTVTTAALVLTAIGFYMWKEREPKKDELQERKLHERLAELNSEARISAHRIA